MKTCHVNFGLGIGARILHLDANNSFHSSLLSFIFSLRPGEGLRCSRSKLHIDWLVGFGVLRQIKKPRAMDAFHLGMMNDGGHWYGPSTEQQRNGRLLGRNPRQSSRFSETMAFLAHWRQSFYPYVNSVMQFLSAFLYILFHWDSNTFTFVDRLSDLIYTFVQDHPQSLHGQHSFKRSSRNIKLMNSEQYSVYGLLTMREAKNDLSPESNF